MAEQIISPGVFTKENDLSFLPQGVEAIGAAVVGPTVKGPAFHPTIIRSFSEFERKFGGLSNDTFVPNTVREYIRSAGAVTVVRVLAGGGYTFTTGTNSPIAIGVGGDRASTLLTFSNAPDAADAITLIAADGTTATLTAHASATSGTTFSRAAADNGVDALQTAITTNFGTKFIMSQPTSTSLLLTQQIPGTKGNTAVVHDLTNVTAVSSAGGANVFGGGTDKLITGIIYPSMYPGTPDLSESTLEGNTAGYGSASLSASFAINLKGLTGGAGATSGTDYSASLNPANNNYLFKQIGYKPSVSKTGAVAFEGTPGYSYIDFKNLNTDFVANQNVSGYQAGNTSSIFMSEATSNITFNGNKAYTEGYSWASTPTVVSGYLDPGKDASKVQELFSFHTLAHGTSCNMDYKISILNQKTISDIDGEEQYSTFSVQVRKYSDKDKSPSVLETFNGCNLNPDSSNYIAKKIGDRYSHYNSTVGKMETLGSYNNLSGYIRVEMNDAVNEGSTSPKLLPKGFKSVMNPIATTSWYSGSNTGDIAYPSASYEGTQVVGGNYSSKACLGWKFDDKRTDNSNWIKPIDSTQETNIAGNFNVDDHHGHASATYSLSLSASIDSTGATGPESSQLKFSIPFQGGFDGLAPYTPKFTGAETTLAGTYTGGTNIFGFDLSTTAKAGYTAYKKALDILSNQDEWDINMLAIPGVLKEYHSVVTQAGIDMVEDRGDAFYVMDLCNAKATVNTAVSKAEGIDTNYAAVYYPWVKVQGATKPMFVPPSVIVPGAIAKSDQIGQGEWFAPAGLNRGVLGNVIEAKNRLNQSERDRLYEERINPIATFPGISSPCIWGQKTLQVRSTALDRINVRRLLIAVKKFIASSSKFLVFEANTAKTRARFLNIVNPYLEGIQQRQGLFAFRVQMDGSNNTPDVIDRNQLVGGIFLQPTKTAEFIVLDFNILPTGATFDA